LTASALRASLGAVRRHGLLLLHDAELDCVSCIVAGEPVRGSWWSHRRGREIFRVSEALEAHPDVAVAPLVRGKVTFVHRRLWPALAAVATAGEAWQLRGLSAAGRRLLERVRREGEIAGGAKGAAREVAERLLVRATQIHTASGKHVRLLESWERWITRMELGTCPSPARARAELERATALLGPKGRFTDLPWLAPATRPGTRARGRARRG
jgi:hypothetical protein